jgi:hypothetical protein
MDSTISLELPLYRERVPETRNCQIFTPSIQYVVSRYIPNLGPDDFSQSHTLILVGKVNLQHKVPYFSSSYLYDDANRKRGSRGRWICTSPDRCAPFQEGRRVVQLSFED